MKNRWLLGLACVLALCLGASVAMAEAEPLRVTDVRVNSYIARPFNGADFVPSNLVDGQSDTCWQVRVRDGMKLSDVYVDLTLEKPSDTNELWIKNGFWRFTNGYNQYIRNSRVKTLAVSVLQEGATDFSAPISFELPNLPRWMEAELPDSDWLRLDISGYHQVVKVRLMVMDVHRGTKYPDDIAISEVQLMGKISGYQDYVIAFADQNGSPVPGVTIMLMSSAGGQPMTSDALGQISFSGMPDAYRLFVTAVPEGYQADMLQGYELPAEGGTLQIGLTKQ